MRWRDGGMQLVRAVAASLTLAIALPAPADAGRLPGQRSLSTTKWGYQIVKAPTRAGSQAQRFEVRAGDCGTDEGWSDCATDRERSEISVKKRWRFGQEMWIGYSVYLPPDFATSSRVRTTVGQIHQTGGPIGRAYGLPSFPPLVQLEMIGNRYYANVHVLTGSTSNVTDRSREFPLASIASMRGRWTDIMIHLDTTNGAQVLDFYVNGKRAGGIRDFIQFKPREYYFKYGIYRSFVSKNGGPMPTQILVIDEVKMGNSVARVAVQNNRPVD